MYASNQIPRYTEPREKVELYFACRKLVNLDVMSKTDPFIIIYEQPVPKYNGDTSYSPNTWIKIGKQPLFCC